MLLCLVVPYIGTWIETEWVQRIISWVIVVPYIGTWIETYRRKLRKIFGSVVPYIGTWIETAVLEKSMKPEGRTLYRYVD